MNPYQGTSISKKGVDTTILLTHNTTDTGKLPNNKTNKKHYLNYIKIISSFKSSSGITMLAYLN